MRAVKISARRLADLLPPTSGTGARYLGVAEAVRLLVGDGRLLAGTVLPSERDLAPALGVSRTTVTRAYDVLREQGVVVSRRGSGTVVAAAGLPALAGADLRGARTSGPQSLRPTPLPLGSAGLAPRAGTLDLTCAAPSGQDELLRWFEVALAHLPAYVHDAGYHPLGLPVLREAIARRFSERGLPTDADQILVTTGALSGIAVVARAFVAPGDRVLTENPTYPGAISALRHAGARIVGIPAEGDLAQETRAVLRATPVGLALLTPDFHNPTGRLVGTAERRELAAELRAGGVRAVADETLVETALDRETVMPAPFAACARSALTIGSASKSHWGGLRLGWIRAPREDMPALATARLGIDVGAPVLEQLALAAMLADGVHVSETGRAAHARQCAALVAAVRQTLPSWSFVEPTGGLSLWCRLPGDFSSALVARAQALGTMLVPGAAFSIDGAGLEGRLRLPFALEPDALRRAVADIARAADELGGRGAEAVVAATVVA